MSLLYLSMGWAVLVLILSVWLFHRGPDFQIPKNSSLIIISTSLLIRLLPGLVLVQVPNYDINSYALVSDHVLAEEDVYTSKDTLNRHPYLPLAMYWMAFARWISTLLHFPFDRFVKLLPILTDAILSLVIYQYVKKISSVNEAFFAGMVYAISPIAVMVSSYHGQFDSFPALFLIIAIWQANKSRYFAGWWSGLGVLVKSWPVLALPSILISFKQRKQSLAFLIAFSTALIIGILFYTLYFHADPFIVVRSALVYNRGVGIWGYTFFIRLLSIIWSDWGNEIYYFIINYGRYFTFGILALIWIFIAKKENLASGILTVLISFFAFTHAFATQYLMWLIPLAIINQEYRWLKLYTLASFAYMFLVYNTLILNLSIYNLLPKSVADLGLIIPASLPIWIITVAWVIQRIQKAQRITALRNELNISAI